MAKLRIGIGSDFRLKDQKLGLGKNNPQERLDVAGVAKGQDLKVTGISSLTAYEGFLRADHQIAENTTLSSDQGPVSSLSGEIIVGTGQTVTVSKVEDEFANANDGTVWSAYLSNSAGGFQAAYPASQAFNGKISATETSRSVNSQITSTWTPPKEITYSSSVEVWTYYAGSVSLNGGTAITVNNDQSWRKIGSGSGTLTSITFSSNSGNSVYIAGIAIDGEILVDGFSTPVDKGGSAGGSEIECLKVYNTFTPPSGGTNERPYAPKPGELYYNYDLKTIEFHDGHDWRQVDNTTRSGRSLFAGGRGDPGSGSSIDYTQVYSMQVNTLGSVVDFGDLTLNQRYGGAGCSNSTRGIVGGGWQSPVQNFEIEYFTLASGGNGIDWGQNNAGGWGSQGASSSTRGLNAGGGYPTATATIESIFFSTVGTKEDFGDISAIRFRGDRACNSTVRGVFSGGYNPSLVSTMDAKDLHSTADTLEFGDLGRVHIGLSAASDSTRGVWMGGWAGAIPAGSGSDVAIDMITIATFGNAVEFGELSDERHGPGSCQNMTRGVVAGGNTPGSSLRGEYITIQSAGNAIDWGDLQHQSTTILSQPVAMPDSHGGLGGF